MIGPPPGKSRRSGYALTMRGVTVSALAVSAASLMQTGWSRFLTVAAVAVIVAAPLARIFWLIYRWRHEGDWVFVLLGVGLVGVIVAGAVIAA